jgi:hyperosmotically inducible periplasmic protein
MKKILSLLALAGFAMSTLVLAPGCASTPTRASTGEFIDDSVITTKVKAALIHDDNTPGSAIKVETFKGVVQLSGFVDTRAQKRRAEVLATGVSGVREVVNNITVK